VTREPDDSIDFKAAVPMPRRAVKAVALIGALVLGTGAVVFHPSRPLYMRHRAVEITVNDGGTLRGTVSKPRWTRKPFPAVVIVHGSGPLTRRHLIGDTHALVRLGFAVLAYDKRGAGESTGVYLRGGGSAADALLRRLAADAAAAFDELAADPEVDTARLGFFGASQAGWIIPLAAELTRTQPRFHIILSGPAVSTGVEQYYSDLTGDGMRPPRVEERTEVERLVSSFIGQPGFDPAPVLAESRVPSLWLLGDRDQSVPAFASARVLESLRAAGNDRHSVIRYPDANHALRDVLTDEPVPVWDDMMTWLREIGVLDQPQ
jgi:dienelactone hydrolase